mgnify:FL=1
MATCPNRKHPDWIKLVSNVGLYGAYSMYTKNNNKTPNVQVDLRLPKDPNKGLSNAQVKNVNKRLKEYNALMNTRHRINYKKLGQSTLYSYEIVENFNRDKYIAEPFATAVGEFNDVGDFLPPQYQVAAKGDPGIELNNKMRSFLDTIGVEYKAVDEILDANGNPIDVVAKADMLNRVVEVVEGKAGLDTLPEEAAHFFVKYLRAKGSPLYKSMMREIEQYEAFGNVMNNPVYQKQYENDPILMREEAIGKVIAQQIVAQETGADTPQKVSRFRRWFDKVMNFIRKTFKMPKSDPFAQASFAIMNDQLNGIKELKNVDLGTEQFFQAEDTNPMSDKQRVESILNQLDETSRRLESRDVKNAKVEELAALGKQIVLDPAGTTKRYYDTEADKIIANRVSDKPSAQFIRNVGKERAIEINENRNNEIKRTGGTNHHNTMERIMILLSEKKGDKKQIQKESGLTEGQFNVLYSLAAEQYANAKEMQAKIDPEGELVVKTEQIVYDPIGRKGLVAEETAGTIDLMFIYSDGTVDVLDYKFITPRPEFVQSYGKNARIIQNPHVGKMDQYNMQIGAYKDILQRQYGVKHVRKSRVIPIHVQYESKKIDGKYQLTGKVVKMEAGGKAAGLSGNEFLQQIPLANELFGDKGIDKLIKRLTSRKGALIQKRKKVRNNPQKYDKLSAEIESIQQSLTALQLNGGLDTVLTEVARQVRSLEKRIGVKDKFLPDGAENPDYIEMDELVDLIDKFSLYTGMSKYSRDFFNDLREVDEAAYNKLVKRFDRASGVIQRTHEDLKSELADRVVGMGQEFGVGDPTRLVKEFSFLTKTFATASEFDHPVFQTAWGYIDRAQQRTRRAQNELEKEIKKYQGGVEQWAKDNGMSLMDAFNLMIDENTGNLVGKYTPEYYQRVRDAAKNNDVAWAKETFQKKEGYQEKFEKWKEREFARIDEMFADYEEYNEKTGKYEKVPDPNNVRAKKREAMKQAWLNAHDLSRDSAWTSPKAWYHLEIKPEKEALYYSDKYRYLNDRKPLKEFFDFYQRTNRKFAEMSGLGIKGNFIANIHQDIIDSIAAGNYDLSSDTLLEGLKIREDDNFKGGMLDEITGLPIATIPALYMAPVRNSNGEVDNSLKTKDLGRALYLMGKSVHNYAHKSEIEAHILALQSFLIDNPAALRDATGNAFLDKTGKLAEKMNSRDTLETFEQLYVNFYLYGQRIQTKDADWGGYSKNKVIQGAKQYFSAKVLGLAFIPGTAAYLAAKASAYMEGAKGLHYNNKQMAETHRLFYKQKDKYLGLVNFFQPWQDDFTMRVANNLSASKLVKTATMDKLYYPYRKADEMIDNNILIAMSQNYGVNEQGMPKRLELLPEGSKSIFELTTINEDGLKIEGMSEEGMNKFRGIVRYVGGTVKGQMSDEDINVVNTTLTGNVVMQFKNWMPRLVRERLGAFRYNPVADVYEQGRYSVIAGEAWQLEENFFGKIKGTLTTALKLSADATTFGLGYKMKANKEVAEKLFKQYLQDNPDNPNIQKMSFNEYFAMRQGQIRAAAAELRMVLLLATSLLALGMKGEDDERLYTKTWATRKLYSSLSRTAMELGFLSNPNEMVSFIRTPVPMTGVVIDALKATNNTWDEVVDAITQREDNRDKTPWGYYSLPFFPGYKQMSRILEVYEQSKVNPYQ